MQHQTFYDCIKEFSSLPDNWKYSNFKEKTIVDFGVLDERLHQMVIEYGAAHCFVFGECTSSQALKSVTYVNDGQFELRNIKGDVGFFDCRTRKNFNHVSGVTHLIDAMSNSMNDDGVLYAVLKSGVEIHGYDISNPIVQSASAALPTNNYLLHDLLASCTVRILSDIPTSNAGECLRLIRLSKKKPSILLIFGESHSGKTSLARDLVCLDEYMHLSNDYVYSGLVEIAARGEKNAAVPKELLDIVGNGSGAACYAFNRSLALNPDLLRIYVELLIPLIPRNKRVVSMDFDLRNENSICIVKECLDAAGFSVWTVKR